MLPKIQEPVIYPVCPLPPPEDAFVVIAPGLVRTTLYVNINAYPCAHGHIRETLITKIAKETGVIMERMLYECKGCSMAKGSE